MAQDNAPTTDKSKGKEPVKDEKTPTVNGSKDDKSTADGKKAEPEFAAGVYLVSNHHIIIIIPTTALPRVSVC